MKTYTLAQINAMVDPKKHIVQIEDPFAIIIETEKPFRLIKAFQGKEDEYVEIDIMNIASFIAARLASHIDSEEFLKHLLIDHSHPTELLELEERLKNEDATITPANRCYSLMIGGKKGRPYEFTLVT